jgi:hypothetical protein
MKNKRNFKCSAQPEDGSTRGAETCCCYTWFNYPFNCNYLTQSCVRLYNYIHIYIYIYEYIHMLHKALDPHQIVFTRLRKVKTKRKWLWSLSKHYSLQLLRRTKGKQEKLTALRKIHTRRP